jgi:hypothetical protein
MDGLRRIWHRILGLIGLGLWIAGYEGTFIIVGYFRVHLFPSYTLPRWMFVCRWPFHPSVLKNPLFLVIRYPSFEESGRSIPCGALSQITPFAGSFRLNTSSYSTSFDFGRVTATRFLHEKINTGSKLHWTPIERQRCPIYNIDLTVEHIWMEYIVAKAVWQELMEILKYFGMERWCMTIVPSRNRHSMMVFMAFSPGYEGAKDRRWKILY